MEIINFEYKDNKPYAVLKSKKGTQFRVPFGKFGIEVWEGCPENAKKFIENFLKSKEVLDFSYTWGKKLTPKQKWIEKKIAISLYELDSGENFIPTSNFRQRRKTVYRPHY
ncbi:hypothetical protein [Cetobacterium sp.]|uniref:hypothetical protein n=1 Tax=Cetobacterium sp. TaxID=2071632 RepID=UPI003F36881B